MTDTATLKTPADVRGDVARIVQRELFAAESPWPRTIHIPWPKETQLVADVAGVHAANNALKEFAIRLPNRLHLAQNGHGRVACRAYPCA